MTTRYPCCDHCPPGLQHTVPAHPEPCEKCTAENGRSTDRCERCRNYLSLCGHDLPFSERAKSIRANYTGWGPTK